MFVAEPYVTIVDLDKKVDYPFLILACDGVWDVFSDQAAVDLILERYLVEGPFAGAAQLLVNLFVFAFFAFVFVYFIWFTLMN